MRRISERTLTPSEERDWDVLRSQAADAPGRWDHLIATFGARWLRDRPDWLTQLVARISAELDGGRGASFVRLGDGEGNVLAMSDRLPPLLVDYGAETVGSLHFGDPMVLVEHPEPLLSDMEAAIRVADVVGVPNRGRVEFCVAKQHRRAAQGSAAVITWCCLEGDAGAWDSTVVAPAGFHRDLLPHYEALVAGRPICLVSPHPEGATRLATAFSAARVEHIAVPRQSLIQATPDPTGHYPERYHEVREEISRVDPGTLVLVAAGMPGKVYCADAKRAGAVGLDIGSIADTWMGIRSRFDMPPPKMREWILPAEEPRPAG